MGFVSIVTSMIYVQLRKVGKMTDRIAFVGEAQVLDERIYVDTRSGAGYDAVLKKLAPMIKHLTFKYSLYGNEADDTKQDIIVHMLEGLPKYNGNRGIKLSTYLQMCVETRMINAFKFHSQPSKSATLLNVRAYTIVCGKCGLSFKATMYKDETIECPECSCLVGKDTKKLSIPILPVNESDVKFDGKDDYKGDDYRGESLFERTPNNDMPIDEQVIKTCDMMKRLDSGDPRLKQVVGLICFHDQSMRSVAKLLGVSSQTIKNWLTELKD